MIKLGKIGILTYYYKTHNYGGILQSYALTYFLIKNGLNADQICYVRKDERPFTIEEYEPTHVPSLLVRLKNRLLLHKYNNFIKPKFVARNEKFESFENRIPHSKMVYDLSSITSANEIYESFIIGSDQIWTFRCFNPSFFGEFVTDNKKLISYAASAGKSVFSDREKEYLQKNLSRFDAISVRESDLIQAFSFLHNEKKIECVVDPTLLLTSDEWNQIAVENLIDGKYLFCYFLGGDVRLRKLANRYAKNHGLKVVSIPFANENFNNSDFNFADINIYDAGPKEFISLIKNASCVFTDSFHATVFSLIYKKEFFVFNRIEHKSMCSRLYSLTKMFECEDHFCDSEEKFDLQYLDSLLNIDYQKKFDFFENQKKKSISFLINNLVD